MILTILIILACVLLVRSVPIAHFILRMGEHTQHHLQSLPHQLLAKLFPHRNAMPPTIHFVRHAQGYHNLNVANHNIHDPLLTPYGKQQCDHLASTYPYAAEAELIVASPLKRTIYTALFSFSDIVNKKNLSIVALPEVQETSDLPCDTGSSPEEIKKEFEQYRIDVSMLDDKWNSKQGRWAPNREAIDERARAARRWLKARPEKDIIVVTHGGVLHYITEDWVGSDKFAGTGWANTEFRSYTFDPASGNNASLCETAESRTRRRGTEKPLSEAEQRNLKYTATAEWEKAGYQKDKSELKIPAKV